MRITGRTESVVFAEIKLLCTSPGYIHALAYLCRRDNFVAYADSLTTEDFSGFFSPSRLIRTELSTLLGLLVTEAIDFTLPSPKTLQTYIDNTDELLEELHGCLNSPMADGFQEMIRDPKLADFLSKGSVLRETIFYSSESAYGFQYRDLAPSKYRGDASWLMSNKGFTIDEAVTAIRAISALQGNRFDRLHETLRNSNPDTWSFLPFFTFQAHEIAKESTQSEETVQSILKAFMLPTGERNRQFRALDDFNATNAQPILEGDGGSFILFQLNSLYEAVYESPFFWMVKDAAYKDTALKNRGKFTEQFSGECLRRAFPAKNVYLNAKLVRDAHTTLGEIDALVLFGDRAMVLQAKSKRLTLAARKGNDGIIKDDFKKSVQDSYDQAQLCAKLLTERKALCLDHSGQLIKVPPLKKVYPLCVVSDHYPGLSFQARQFLQIDTTEKMPPPFVMDVFTLDVMAEMLQSPLYFLSYVDRRTEYADKIAASHELTILSYHLKQNLWMSGEYDRVMLHDDISADLDVAMTVRRDNVPGQRTPTGILTHIKGTAFERLIRQIEHQQRPETLDLGFTLLKMSGESVSQISQGIDRIVEMTSKDHLQHDFSLGSGKTGVTVHCNALPMSEAKLRLAAHVQMRKYKEKASSWFGINVSYGDGSLQFGYNAMFPWEEDDVLAEASKDLKSYPGIQMVNGKMRRKKIGRNDPCPCGSRLKYKKCHGGNS